MNGGFKNKTKPPNLSWERIPDKGSEQCICLQWSKCLLRNCEASVGGGHGHDLGALRAKLGIPRGSPRQKSSRRGPAPSPRVPGPWQLLTLAARSPGRTRPRASGSQLPSPARPGLSREPGAQPAGDPRASGLRAAGVPPLPPARHRQRRPRGSRPRPPRPPPGPRHTPWPGADPRLAGPAHRGRRASGEPPARACGLVGGLHNGAGPLQSGARDPLAHAGRCRSPAVDTLGDPVPLQGAAELTAVGVPPLHPPAGGPVPEPRRRAAAAAAASHLSRRRPPARPASGLDSTPAAGHTDMEPAPGGGGEEGGPGGGRRASSAFGNKEMTIPGPARPTPASRPPRLLCPEGRPA